MKIVLLGYMGCGKTTIAKELASDVNIKYLDLDNYIAKKENTTITQIFSKKGEIYFRLKEQECLKEILTNENQFILSLGGGTPCYSNNIELILSDTTIKVVYLKATIDTLVKHLSNDDTKRPLIKDIPNDGLQEFIAKHLFERSYYYNKAEHVINIDSKSTIGIVKEILSC